MASEQTFVDFVLDQIGLPDRVIGKKMFGEYALYYETKLFGLICDNKLFIKPTMAGKDYMGGDLVEAPPYAGAKPCILIEEKLEDAAWLRLMVLKTVEELPEPKPEREKKKKSSRPIVSFFLGTIPLMK